MGHIYTKAELSHTQNNQVAFFLKTLIVRMSKTTRTHGANNKSLSFSNRLKFYGLASWPMELLTFFVFEQTTVSKLLIGSARDHSVNFVYSKVCWVDLVHWSKVYSLCHYVKKATGKHYIACACWIFKTWETFTLWSVVSKTLTQFLILDRTWFRPRRIE